MPLDSTDRDPTPEQVWECLPLVDGRVSVAWNEMLRLLARCLPDAIAYANAQIGFEEGKGIPLPAGYRVAPESLSDDYINSILVGASVRTESMGTRAFKDTVTLSIYDVAPRVEVREQVDDAWDRSGIIRGVLYPTLSGWIDPQGRKVWGKLQPMGKSPLPPAWENYDGVVLTYELFQYPGDNNWR